MSMILNSDSNQTNPGTPTMSVGYEGPTRKLCGNKQQNLLLKAFGITPLVLSELRIEVFGS